jgi:glycosyltransferase involved in cell wall biosynthesis
MGGLELENNEEIELLKTKYDLLVIDYNYLENITKIVNKEENVIIYVDFVGQNISKLNFLNNILALKPRIFLKYKGYLIDRGVLDIINMYLKFPYKLITTLSNEKIGEYKIKYPQMECIKYWSMDTSKLENQSEPFTLKYELAYEDMERTNHYYTFMFVGRKQEGKGIYDLVKAFESMNIPNTRLICIGQGVLCNHTSEFIFDIPFMKYENILYMIKKYCDCLVLPSVSEGFGRVSVEALYFNKNVIITKKSMFAEIYPEYSNLVDNNLIEKMEQCVKTPVDGKCREVILKYVNENRDRILSIFD